jgi:hypothetical protein
MDNKTSKKSETIHEIISIFLPKVLVNICASYLIIWNFQKQIFIKNCENFFPINDLLFLSGTNNSPKTFFKKKIVTSFSTGKTVGEINTLDLDICDAKWLSDGNSLFLIPSNSRILKVIDYKLVDYGRYNIGDRTGFTVTAPSQDVIFMETYDCLYKFDTYTKEMTRILNNVTIDLILSDNDNLYLIHTPFRTSVSYLTTYDHKNMKKISECQTELIFSFGSNAIVMNKFIYLCDPDDKRIKCVNIQTGIIYDVDIMADYIATDGTKLYVRNGDIVSMYIKN